MPSKKWARRALLGVSAAAPLAFVLLTVPSTTARGGEYHAGTNLICSDCHTMHYSQQHAYDGGAPPTLSPSGGPNDALLKANVNDLCKMCHDGQNYAPDVVGANTGTHVREAGALTTGAAPYEDWKGHTLGSTSVAPGGTWSSAEGLECVNCHSPHGGSGSKDVAGNTVASQYRNLSSRPGGKSGIGISYAKGTNDLTKDIFMRGWTLGAINTNYSIDNLDFNEPVTNESGIGRWCKGCHTDFHGKQGDANMGGTGGSGWLRHPTADSNIGAQTGGHSKLTTFQNRLYRVKVMSASGDWGTQGSAWATAPADLSPTCVSCHKAHGNQNPFGLVYAKGATAMTEEGDGTGVRDMCKQCHSQGG